MKPYLVSLLFAIAAHGALIFGSSHSFFHASLPLQSGSEALSVVLINHVLINHALINPVLVNPALKNRLPDKSAPKSIEQQNIKPNFHPKLQTKQQTQRVVDAISKRLRVQKEQKKQKDQNTPQSPASEPVLAQKKNSTRSLVAVIKKAKGVVSQAVPTSSHQPTYPRRAILRNQQGRVEVSLLIDEAGLATNSSLLKSSGFSLLDHSVLTFIEEEKFIPATLNGVAIASAQVFSFRFELN